VLSSLDVWLEKVPHFSPSPQIPILPGFQTEENLLSWSCHATTWSPAKIVKVVELVHG